MRIRMIAHEDGQLIRDMSAEIRNVEDSAIIFDEDCPEMTEEQLKLAASKRNDALTPEGRQRLRKRSWIAYLQGYYEEFITDWGDPTDDELELARERGIVLVETPDTSKEETVA